MSTGGAQSILEDLLDPSLNTSMTSPLPTSNLSITNDNKMTPSPAPALDLLDLLSDDPSSSQNNPV